MRLSVIVSLLLIIGCKPSPNTMKLDDVVLPIHLFDKTTSPQKVGTDYEFTEGPATDKEGNVYFTDQPNDKIYKWHAETNEINLFSSNTRRANGLFIDEQNRLFSCSDLYGEILEFSLKDGSFVIRANSSNSERFNGPNDLWINSSGGIYFTDPNYTRSYWDNPENQEWIDHMSLYYLPSDSRIPVLIDTGFVKPNGIIGSEKRGKLYVTDQAGGKTFVYDLNTDGTSCSNKTLFCELGSDGMTLDENGNLYLTGNGVTIFNPKGEVIDTIPIAEEWTSNVTFAGKNNDLLFITASKSVYVYQMNLKGE